MPFDNELEKAGLTTEVGLPSADNSQRITDNSFSGMNRGLFSYQANDVISSVIRGQSKLLNWLPWTASNVWNEKVAHLTAVFGKDFDGSESYIDYITADADPAECDFGSGAMQFQVHEYSVGYRRISTSNKNNPLNHFDFGGMRQWQKSPLVQFRGHDAGLRINNDAEWALSMLAMDMEEHINYSAWWGDADRPTTKGMFYGMDSIITDGYVRARAENKGDASIFSDPLVYSGVSLNTPETLLRFIRNVIRHQYARFSQRGVTPAFGDYVVWMPRGIWEECAEVMAAGLFNYRAMNGIQFQTTPEVFQREKQRYMTAGLGEGAIPVPGIGEIPVVTDEALGTSIANVNGNESVTGDVYILLRRAYGLNALEMQYINWNEIPSASNPPAGNSHTAGNYLPQAYQNGMFRGSWQEVNNACYYYGMEAYMRMITRMQHFQAKITDVTIEVDRLRNAEAASWTHPNYYAFSAQGNIGGQGESLISGILDE